MSDLLNRIFDATIIALIIMLSIIGGIGLAAFIIEGAEKIIKFVAKNGVCI